MTNEKQGALATQKTEDNMGVKYEVGGETVALSFSTVKNYLVRGNAEVSTQEVVLFMNWCKFNELNPWNNEAYLIKYDSSKPAQNVTGKEAFMKRAEDHPMYDGYKAGLILGRSGEVVEVEGAFSVKGDEILGGWCEVFRKDRKYPITVKVNFDEYNKQQSTWKAMPKTMIRKVAMVQALREAFPKNLSSMYTEEEIQEAEVVDEEQKVEQEIRQNANKTTVAFDDIPEAEPTPQQQKTSSKPANNIKGQQSITDIDPGF